jgi:hypothetical protein
MDTFLKFFTGTTGVILAVILCGLCSAVACIAAVLVSAMPVIATMTPVP